MPVSYPKVHPNDVKNFARAWDLNGINMILDATSLQFATDFANTAIRSYVDDLTEKAKAALRAKQAASTQANSAAPVQAEPVPAPTKSSIILTDM